MLDEIIQNIVNAMNTEIAGVLGSEFKSLAYVADVSRNSFRQSSNRYGVLHGPASQLPGVTRNLTFNQTFTVVLTKGYRESTISDEAARTASIDLYGKMHEIHKQLVASKAGLPGTVLNVEATIEVQEPEYIVEEKVTALRADIQVLYRYDLV